MFSDQDTLRVLPQKSIHHAMAQMDANRLGIVLVVDNDGRLIDTVTDGDVRRAILAGISIEFPVSDLLEQKAGSINSQPIVAPVDTNSGTLLNILRQHGIRHLPLVDHEQRVVDMVTLNQLVSDDVHLPQAVIMAGGAGSRLRPLTEEMPKPMLPIGGQPLMELIVEQLREVGIKQISVSVHHKSEKIIEHFGDGSGFGVEMHYLTEERPLGTAGSLTGMQAAQETLLVINGDVLTQVDYRAMLAYHREHHADLTVAVQQHDIQVPYGVIECHDVWVSQLVEKPVLTSLVNAGIYFLEPVALEHIPKSGYFDMTDLIKKLVERNLAVAAFPLHEYWLDIGKPEDYREAQQKMEKESNS